MINLIHICLYLFFHLYFAFGLTISPTYDKIRVRVLTSINKTFVIILFVIEAFTCLLWGLSSRWCGVVDDGRQMALTLMIATFLHIRTLILITSKMKHLESKLTLLLIVMLIIGCVSIVQLISLWKVSMIGGLSLLPHVLQRCLVDALWYALVVIPVESRRVNHRL
jgi:hypothetical protein